MPWRLFTNEYWSPTKIQNSTHGLKYTNSLTSDSYFDLLLKVDLKEYTTGHGARRDTSTSYSIFGSGENEWFADEAPVGFFEVLSLVLREDSHLVERSVLQGTPV